ncbi:MAG: hypothetical protein SW833_12830 [Cyanobacteriota bacterium]|nr:hypothetical protein [Cyanobacteriota bacterium]
MVPILFWCSLVIDIYLHSTGFGIIRDRALRHTLIQRGKRQARQFSWEKTAKETLKAYRSI